MCFKLVNSGASGPRGPPGVCSCNLTTLFAPGNVPELLPGPQGNPGVDGKIGLTGLPVSMIIVVIIITIITVKTVIIIRATYTEIVFYRLPLLRRNPSTWTWTFFGG